MIVQSYAYAATPVVTTFQTRITGPSGAPLESASVNFRFTILDSTGTCTLYVEDYASVNMSSSQGIVSFSLGSGAKVFPAGLVTMAEVFNNSAPSFTCQTSGTYAPNPTDRRQIVMQFNDGGGWQTLPAMAINSVFYANYATRADNLGNYPANDYLRPVTLPTCTGSQALNFNGTAFTCIAAGGGAGGIASITATSPIAITGATSTPIVSIPKAAAAADGYLSSADWTTFNNKASATLTAGQIYLGSVGNTATGVALSGDATIAATGVMTLANSGVTAGTYGSVNAVPYLTIDLKGRVTSANSGAYQYATAVDKGVVQIGSNLTISSGVVSMTSADITSALGFAPLNGGFANNGNSFSADATLGTNDNFKLNFETNNVTRMTIGTSGNVGIGTTTPNAALAVAGAVYVGDNAVSTVLGGGGLTWNGATITVGSTAGYPDKGILLIEKEVIRYSSKTGTTFAVADRTGGVGGSGQLAHAAGVAVYPALLTAQNSLLDPSFAVFSNGLSTSPILQGNNVIARNDLTVNGARAFATGFSNGPNSTITTNGMGSLLSGNNLTSNANYAGAIGDNLEIDSMNSFAIGRYNVGGGSYNVWVPTEPIFEIGIGTSTGPMKANAMTVLKNGNIGIGTATPSVKLQVDGSVRATSGVITANYATDTDLTIDFSQANLITTSANCGATTLSNMVDGGSYTLVVTGTTTGTCTFTHAGVTAFKFAPTNGPTDVSASGETVYTFLKVGAKVYVAWITGMK